MLSKLQKLLNEKNIDAYIIPISDYHLSEYVPEHFKVIKELTNFSGSAATLLVMQDNALLWTDGRYFLQAEGELNEKIKLMKMNTEGTPSLIEFLNKNLNQYSTLAFDGRTISTNDYLNFKKSLKCNIVIDIDLISKIWEKRPNIPNSMLYELENIFSGESYKSKIDRVFNKMKEHKANVLCITSLEEQAWLFNLRANDIKYTPVFLSYTLIIDNTVHIYIDENKLNEYIKSILNENNIIVHPYNNIYEDISLLENKIIMLDELKVNSLIYKKIPNSNKIINSINPITLLKCIKNETEINNTKHTHILDGAAITKWIIWIKKEIKENNSLTEVVVQNKLEEFRKEHEELIDLSFSSICAYKENGAMLHYNAINGKNSKLQPEGMLMIDSGGHYLYGTTDITRTISLGRPTTEEKLYFTTVLKSMIDLADTVFLKGCTGQNLDIKARGPIWKLLLDYKCGTGHGVGHVLSVHEGPNGFRWNKVENRMDYIVLIPGMITTDEPGIYLEGKFGIRLENELLCKEVITNEWGTFYGFETITYAPIDLDLIDKTLLNADEINWLNDYHKMVYDKLKDYFDDDLEDLKYLTRKI